MRKIARQVFASCAFVASTLTICSVGLGQHSSSRPGFVRPPEFAILNSIGRFFGAGYTLGGYHAGSGYDGRLDIVTQSHPANQYRSGHLQFAYDPNYYPTLPAASRAIPAPVPTAAPPMAPMKAEAEQVEADAVVEESSSTPALPPAAWLEKHLQRQESDGGRAGGNPARPQPKTTQPPTPEISDPARPAKPETDSSPSENLLQDALPEEREQEVEVLFPAADDDLLQSSRRHVIMQPGLAR